MDNDWLDKSITERLQWYNNELDSLFDYLGGKEPFGDEQVLKESADILEGIRDRMEQEREFVSDSKNDIDEKDAWYYEAVLGAQDALPTDDDEREEWFDKLGRANEILVGAK